MASKIIITDAGRAELINAQQTGTNTVTLSEVAFGTGQYTAQASRTALQAEFKRLDAIAGGAIDNDLIHFTVLDDSSDAYSVFELGVFTDKGTLFAVYSQTTPIVQKAGPSQAMLAVDIKLEDLDATNVTIGETTFTMPPATETRQGVVELATAGETIEGTHQYRAVTPAGLHAKTATASRRGLVQLATDEEVLAGTGTARAVTPAGLQLRMGNHEKIQASSTASGHVTVDGTSVVSTDGRLSVPLFKGYESATNAGAAGLVPKAEKSNLYLRSNGEWQSLSDAIDTTFTNIPASANGLRKAYERGTEGVELAQAVENFVYNDVLTTINDINARITNDTLTPFCINQGPLDTNGVPNVLSFENRDLGIQEVAFVQPTLTANGTMGGDSFAVYSNPSSSNTYHAFGSGNEFSFSDQNVPSESSPQVLVIYNPEPIKLSSFSWRNASVTSRIWKRMRIKGSTDGNSWTQLLDAQNNNLNNQQSVTVGVAATVAYKYFRIEFLEVNGTQYGVLIKDVKLNGTVTKPVEGGTLKFKGPLVATTATGEKFTVGQIADLDVSAARVSTVYIYLDRAGTPTFTMSELHVGPQEPTTAVPGEIWFQTVEPLATYLRLVDQWYEIYLVPVGEAYLDGTGRITAVSTYPYNQNGYTVNSGTVATASTFGLMRVASPEDETNCTCNDASVTPSNFMKMGDYRLAETEYQEGDQVECLYHADLYLVCTTAGMTSAEALDTRTIEVDQSITDGTVTWVVRKRSVSFDVGDVRERDTAKPTYGLV